MKQCYSLFRLSIIMLLSMLLLSQNSIGQVFFVNKTTGSDANNGTAWASAFRSIQKALVVATNPGTKIFVAAGTYYPDDGFGATDNLRTSTFTLKNQVSLYGGFEPQFGIDDLGDTRVKRSTLSGDLLQNDITAPGPDNAFHVVTSQGAGEATVLDGFSIISGNANGGSLNNFGAGMLNSGSAPTINNCLFSENSAQSGGAVYNDNGSPVFTDCSFLNNTATDGGGMYNVQSSPQIKNCNFSGNTAARGGGICNLNGSAAVIVNCSFSANAATNYGGGFYNEGSSPTLTNARFWGNTAGSYGGGINSWNTATIKLINCTISGNSANSGGAIYQYGLGTLINCIVWGNTATGANGSKNIDYIDNATISYSLVQDYNGGSNNLDGINAANDPLFADATNGNLRLQACSPAIDAGNNASLPVGVDKDIADNTRIVHTTVDMGAYEYAGTLYTYYKDADGDGYGGESKESFCATAPAGYKTASELTAPSGDCNDNDAMYHPGAVEECGDDYNCDGATSTCVECLSPTGYWDGDGDGYGDPSISLENAFCLGGNGYVENNLDCNDNDASIYPSAVEIAGDNKDNDCDGEVDEPENVAPAFTNCPAEAITANAATGTCSAKINLILTATGVPEPGIAYTVEGNAINIADYAFPVGTTVVIATASNGFGEDASCIFSVTVSDQQAPVLADASIGCSSLDQSGINECVSTAQDFDGTSLETSVAALYNDNCGSVTASYSGITAGTHNSNCSWSFTYEYTISDGHGNNTTCSVTRSGGDYTPPTGALQPAASYLWPPNHKMRDITLNKIGFGDNCTAAVGYHITSVSSNEAVSNGDGDTDPDWIISTDKQSLQLRAERSGTGSGRIYTINYELSDDCGNKTPGTTYVYVSHDIKKPVIGASFKKGTVIPLAGEFGDIAGRKHTAKWIIDGTSITGTVTEPSTGKPGTVTGSWKPNAPGVYSVQLNITDQYGNTSYVNTNGDMQAVIVVYDPNGGYTFGQGMFKAPAGSVPSNPAAAPQVTYGFQSNYFKKAANPKGETQLDFDAGDFRFNALNFDYLAVNGKNAQFKGTGKIINAAGETIQSGVYFLLTVMDNGENTSFGIDKIRMKIYNKNTDQVYFDNQPGAGDAALPEQVVSKGSTIGIVSSNMTVSATTNVSTRSAASVNIEKDITVQDDELHVYPNPVTDRFAVRMKLPVINNSAAMIQVLDMSGKQVLTQAANAVNGYLQAQVAMPSTLSDGLYIIKIVVAERQYYRKLLLSK